MARIDGKSSTNILPLVFAGENAPVHLPPPPRVVHGGGGCALWGIRLFIMPHVCVGVGMVGLLLVTILLAVFGAETQAVVTKAHTTTGNKGGITYHIKYRYSVGGHEYEGSGSVKADTYARLSDAAELEGQRSFVRVRYLDFGFFRREVLIEDHSVWFEVGSLLLFALFWNAILSVFVTLVWIVPIRQRLLVKHGEVAPGTIVSVRTRQGKSITHYAKFRFRDPQSGAEIEREMTVPSAALYQGAIPDRTVTVIYSPRKPKRAVVYELCSYVVEGAQAT